MTTKTESQNKQILRYLMNGKKLTPLKALDKFGCLRLSARIYDLKDKGHNIQMKLIQDEKTNKRYSEYYMPQYEKTTLQKRILEKFVAKAGGKRSVEVTKRIRNVNRLNPFDSSNPEHQIGCGYCKHELTCHERDPSINKAKLGCKNYIHYSK